MLARDGATSQGRGEDVDREGWEVECLEEEVRWSREEVTKSGGGWRIGGWVTRRGEREACWDGWVGATKGGDAVRVESKAVLDLDRGVDGLEERGDEDSKEEKEEALERNLGE